MGLLRGRGIEIGAHGLPIEGIQPVYVDRFRTFAGSDCNADILADGGKLPFARESLDYIASSHLLEHLSNPIAAIDDWHRTLKPGGMLYLVVPDRRYTFDHRRQRTSLSHLVDDFERGTTDRDATHIEEFFDVVDPDLFLPGLPKEKRAPYLAESKAEHLAIIARGDAINLHFHVFEKEDVLALLELANRDSRLRHRWNVIAVAERYPPGRGDGFLVVARRG
jgi:SAM-dependent methyltransferase